MVEQNEMVRATILTGLRNEGATVLASDRPDDALRLLASHPGPVDVLVTDVVMPGMSGPALAERGPAKAGQTCALCSCPATLSRKS